MCTINKHISIHTYTYTCVDIHTNFPLSLEFTYTDPASV